MKKNPELPHGSAVATYGRLLNKQNYEIRYCTLDREPGAAFNFDVSFIKHGFDPACQGSRWVNFALHKKELLCP